MTREQFVAAWPGASPEARFANFVLWVTSRIVGYPQWVSPIFRLVDSSGGGDCDPGYDLPRSLFEEATADGAVALGYQIIAACSNLAQANYIKAYKEADKQRQKQIDKWLDKMQKELIKDMLKAYAEMAKYYAKKYEAEKGS